MTAESKKSSIGRHIYHSLGIYQPRLLQLKQIFCLICITVVTWFTCISVAQAQNLSSPSPANQVCVLPQPGSIVNNPPEIKNLTASNPVDFTVLNIAADQNCYLQGGQFNAPTLRVKPSETGNTAIVLRLTNKLPKDPPQTQAKTEQSEAPQTVATNTTTQKLCTGGTPPHNATSFHFHGFNVSPMCHQDEVVKTVISPDETFVYNVEIPGKEPPGLYWYHPHIHMQSEPQVLSGLTGALIVEGIGKFNPRAAKLPERVFILRDLNLSPNIPDSDKQQPGKDISINSVPIRYLGNGKYDKPAVIEMLPNQEQFWRVANTAADTYFDLQLRYDNVPQPLELVAMDGVPLNEGYSSSQKPASVVTHILLPPAGRAEFIVKAPGENVKDAKFMTLNYDTNADSDPERQIAQIDAKTARTAFLATVTPETNVNLEEVSGDRFSGLSENKPIRQRILYFSEFPNDPTATNTQFYITEEGKTPKVYNMNFKVPDITVEEGTTEDWIVQNLAKEAHAFHIHQIHFLVLESSNNKEDIGMLRDTVTLPAWKDSNDPVPYVKLRMDFRGKGSSIAGTFVYHCHILEHEDNGMMGSIEVKKKA
jgi:FtsP/CotA-like multicopper oxidase with cupredoxin domain